jgi:hypothetical protein
MVMLYCTQEALNKMPAMRNFGVMSAVISFVMRFRFHCYFYLYPGCAQYMRFL